MSQSVVFTSTNVFKGYQCRVLKKSTLMWKVSQHNRGEKGRKRFSIKIFLMSNNPVPAAHRQFWISEVMGSNPDWANFLFSPSLNWRGPPSSNCPTYRSIVDSPDSNQCLSEISYFTTATDKLKQKNCHVFHLRKEEFDRVYWRWRFHLVIYIICIILWCQQCSIHAFKLSTASQQHFFTGNQTMLKDAWTDQKKNIII